MRSLQPPDKEVRNHAAADRRKSVRGPAKGAVVLQLHDPEPLEVRGCLVDISAYGFRASHESPSIRTGQQVSFSHAHARGRAQVVWTRIEAREVENGFLILSQD